MRARLFASLIAWGLTVGCGAGSNSIEVTAPSAVKCQVSVANAMSGVVPADGASSTIAVSTTRDCTWTAASDAAWIAITSGANGQGSGTVGYRVTANGDAAQRRGIVEVNNSQIEIVQGPAPCRFTVTPPSATVSADGTNLTETIETLAGCAWTAASPVNWVTVTSSPGGNRSGTVTLAVAVNPGAARAAGVTIAGQVVTIQQSAAATEPNPTNPPPTNPPPTNPPAPPPCTYAIASTTQNVDSDASTVTVGVAAGAGCAWTASSNASWITVASGGSSIGDGAVTLRVAGNTGASRTGTVSIAGKTFTVVQAAVACNYSLGSNSQSIPFDGGNGSVGVTAASPCNWTAASNVPWITITSGRSGTGNGSVAFTVATNAGAARTGTLTIAGRTFTVTQAAAPPPPCTFSIAPGSQNIGDAGGPGSTTVTASAGTCAWTASPNAPWISITKGTSGTGNGVVEYTVAANTGAARTGTVSIGGQTLTVNQAAAPPPCTWTIAPPSQDVPDTGGSVTTAVTASASTCAWTAVPNADWIAIASGGSGSGSGAVTFNVAANAGPARTGTVTVAGQTFTVNQAASPPPCTFSISPPGAMLPAEGGGGSVAIAASAPSCAWTIANPSDWVVISGPAAGTGTAAISYLVAPNSGAARTTTLTIAGQPFTISQSAPGTP